MYMSNEQPVLCAAVKIKAFWPTASSRPDKETNSGCNVALAVDRWALLSPFSAFTTVPLLSIPPTLVSVQKEKEPGLVRWLRS